MGVDIHTFVEHRNGWGAFSGIPEDPALFLAEFSLTRDYAIFDALAGARSNQISTEQRKLPLHKSRGVPVDVSHEVAREYYDLVIDSDQPDPRFWPNHACVSMRDAESRRSAQRNVVAQTINVGTASPRCWNVVAKTHWFSASWLLLAEVRASLEHHKISLEDASWDWRELLGFLSEIERHVGVDQVRLVFWFDK